MTTLTPDPVFITDHVYHLILKSNQDAQIEYAGKLRELCAKNPDLPKEIFCLLNLDDLTRNSSYVSIDFRMIPARRLLVALWILGAHFARRFLPDDFALKTFKRACFLLSATGQKNVNESQGFCFGRITHDLEDLLVENRVLANPVMLAPPPAKIVSKLPRTYFTAFAGKISYLLFGDVEEQLTQALAPYALTDPKWVTLILAEFRRSRTRFHDAQNQKLPGVEPFTAAGVKLPSIHPLTLQPVSCLDPDHVAERILALHRDGREQDWQRLVVALATISIFNTQDQQSFEVVWDKVNYVLKTANLRNKIYDEIRTLHSTDYFTPIFNQFKNHPSSQQVVENNLFKDFKKELKEYMKKIHVSDFTFAKGDYSITIASNEMVPLLCAFYYHALRKRRYTWCRNLIKLVWDWIDYRRNYRSIPYFSPIRPVLDLPEKIFLSLPTYVKTCMVVHAGLRIWRLPLRVIFPPDTPRDRLETFVRLGKHPTIPEKVLCHFGIPVRLNFLGNFAYVPEYDSPKSDIFRLVALVDAIAKALNTTHKLTSDEVRFLIAWFLQLGIGLKTNYSLLARRSIRSPYKDKLIWPDPQHRPDLPNSGWLDLENVLTQTWKNLSAQIPPKSDILTDNTKKPDGYVQLSLF